MSVSQYPPVKLSYNLEMPIDSAAPILMSFYWALVFKEVALRLRTEIKEVDLTVCWCSSNRN